MDLMGMLPRDQYSGEAHVADFQGAVQKALDVLRGDYESLFLQLRISTADWSLSHWEDAWGLQADCALTDQERRARVIAKMRGTKTTTAERLRKVVESFCPADAEVTIRERNPEYIVEVVITNGPEPYRDPRAGVVYAVREIIPAHLGIWYVTETPFDSTLYVGGYVPYTLMKTAPPELLLAYKGDRTAHTRARVAYTFMQTTPPALGE